MNKPSEPPNRVNGSPVSKGSEVKEPPALTPKLKLFANCERALVRKAQSSATAPPMPVLTSCIFKGAFIAGAILNENSFSANKLTENKNITNIKKYFFTFPFSLFLLIIFR
jgi:hypothetical protein